MMEAGFRGFNLHMNGQRHNEMDIITHTHLQPKAIKQELLDDFSHTNFPTQIVYSNNHNTFEETHMGELPNTHRNSDEVYKVNGCVMVDEVMTNDTQNYVCEMCSNTFPAEELLNIHISIDHELNPGLCELCGKTFATKFLLISHFAAHNEQPCRLDVEDEIQEETILPDHAPYEEQSQPWKLDIKEEIQDEAIPLDHVAHDEQPWQLDTLEDFQEETILPDRTSVNEIDVDDVLDKEQDHEDAKKTISELLEDVLCQLGTSSVVNGTTPVPQCNYRVTQNKEPAITICNVCGKELKCNRARKRHSLCGQRPYKCRFCPKAFGTIFYAQVHERIHTGDKPFPCVQCGMTFISNAYLQKHKDLTHVETKLFICDEPNCGKTFPTKAHLKSHVTNAHEDHKAVCEKCGKSFKNALILKTHSATHNDASMKCEECGKGFALQSSLKRHIRLRHEKKPYCCAKCGKTISSKPGLRIHMRVHTGEKPFKCKFCPSQFANQYNLRVHRRIHTGERPYQCQVCSKTFNQSHVLKAHQKRCS